MSYDEFVRAEFDALRAEILQHLQSIAETTRTSLLFAATLYAIPVYLSLTRPEVWVIAILIVDMTLFTMSLRIGVVTNQVRRIGNYIRHVLEPKTRGAMHYERSFHDLIASERAFLDEGSAVVGVCCVVNLLAAYAVAEWLVEPRSGGSTWAIVSAALLLPVLLLTFRQWRRIFAGDEDRDEISRFFSLWAQKNVQNADVRADTRTGKHRIRQAPRVRPVRIMLAAVACAVLWVVRAKRR